MASSLTKEQLKNELISHGVQPPSTNSRKDEFVKLYEQHVAPIASLRGDFSSDEENDVNEKLEKKEQSASNNDSLICGGLNVADLSDEELFAQLQSFGIPVGPIVETTRSVYQKKLAAVLREASIPELDQRNGDDQQVVDEKFSDSEDNASVTELEIDDSPDNFQDNPSDDSPSDLPTQQEDETTSAPAEIISTPEAVTSIRKRGHSRPASSLSARPLVDKQGTPTPRPSIHSISSSSQYTYESRRLLDTIDGSSVQGMKSTSSSGASPKSKIIRYFVLLIIFVVAAYVTYTYLDTSPFKSLMNNIQQKLSQYLEKSGGASEKMDSSQSKPIPDVV